MQGVFAAGYAQSMGERIVDPTDDERSPLITAAVVNKDGVRCDQVSWQ